VPSTESGVAFGPDAYGNGAFGHWFRDADGAPAYRYTCEQATDPRAEYRTSLGGARDHWHLLGNTRLSATCHVDGYIQLWDYARGLKLLNPWSPANAQFSGGFKLIEIDGTHFSTLWRALPHDARQDRSFGTGYIERVTTWRAMTIRERYEISADNEPALRATCEIANHGLAPLRLRLTEFWQPSLRQITPYPLMTGGLRRWADRRRDALNRNYHAHYAHDEQARAIELRYTHKSPRRSPQSRSMLDEFPPGLRLRVLESGGFPHEIAAAAARVHCGPHGLPDRLEHASNAENRAEPRFLAFSHTLEIAPGEKVHLRHALEIVENPAVREGHPAPASKPVPLVQPTLSFREDVPEWLSRELQWHAAYLLAGVKYHDYFDSHFVDQSSAYSHIQGLIGAPRDFAFYAMALTHIAPHLAKEQLRFMLRSQAARGAKQPYAHVGYGLNRGYVLHSFSSDLDLFLLWALAEYIETTGDDAFLDETLPYYPREARAEATVLAHAQAAFDHLCRAVGCGPHGLLRCRTGDWNDVLLAFSRFPPATILRGESALNAGLAALALPKFAQIARGRAPGFADALGAVAESQRTALAQMWTGRWCARGYPGYGRARLGEAQLFLDCQSFPVLADLWSEEQRATLFANIENSCWRPQKVGALALWPPSRGPMLEPGSDTNGGTWAAIDSLTAWAWSRHDPAKAWEFFLASTLAARAEAYPDCWYGIWSGPDAYNAHYHARPAETFLLNFTPMTDFPIMNMNRHACPLLAAAKLGAFKLKQSPPAC